MAVEPVSFLDDSIRDKTLISIQDRVLWLAMQLVHHANNVRTNIDG